MRLFNRLVALFVLLDLAFLAYIATVYRFPAHIPVILWACTVSAVPAILVSWKDGR